ncbi:Hypothetical predicted protein [Mytilus galloprovincialis]|uniref:Uncharacterized protein n=1 Tax=Mytilus galloprovincialis TaxID=29158 RepID=A0A8B6G085_MYTGA|nr:Hypothetical predicted protein [Mytilus galloprovincialis]
MLWKGLRQNLKAISHYEKEKYTTFDSLRVALRRIEKDNILDMPTLKTTTKGTSKRAITKLKNTDDDDDDDDKDDYDEQEEGFTGFMNVITTRLDRIETGMQQHQNQNLYQDQSRGNYRDNKRKHIVIEETIEEMIIEEVKEVITKVIIQQVEVMVKDMRNSNPHLKDSNPHMTDRDLYTVGNVVKRDILREDVPISRINIAFGLTTDTVRQPQSKYIQELRERLVKAYELASKAADRAREKQKTGYDLKARGATLEIGDKVLVKVVAYDDGKHKIADRWEDDVYVIIGQPNSDVPVYTVQKENGEGRRRTLHRNLLLPVGNINQRKPEPPPKPVPPPRTRLRQRIEQPSPEPSDYESSDEELDVLVRLDYDIPPYHMEPILQDMDTPVQNDTELDGDAHSTATGASRDSDDQSTEGSASGDEQAEIVTQPEPVVIPLPPIPVPRRSTRTRLEPEWMRSGKFVHKVAVPVQQQWEQKAKFIFRLFETWFISRIRETSRRGTTRSDY